MTPTITLICIRRAITISTFPFLSHFQLPLLVAHFTPGFYLQQDTKKVEFSLAPLGNFLRIHLVLKAALGAPWALSTLLPRT